MVLLQATKEAEHREKLEELRAKIADNKAKFGAAEDSLLLHKVGLIPSPCCLPQQASEAPSPSYSMSHNTQAQH